MIPTDRTGDWIQTASGKAFFPMDPRAAEVDLFDIAHALANQCRYGGHCSRFYSVAEHSVHVSHQVPAEHAMTALLHDATEAYCVDVPRPLKRFLQGYADIERTLWNAVAERFGLPATMHESVHVADNAVLLAEKAQLLGPSPAEWTWARNLTPADVTIEFWSPQEAKHRFLGRYFQLWGAAT